MPLFDLFDAFCGAIQEHAHMHGHRSYLPADTPWVYRYACQSCSEMFEINASVVARARDVAQSSPNYRLLEFFASNEVRPQFIRDLLGEVSEDHVKPEIAALVRRGSITLTEVKELRANSWEWEAIAVACNDEAFLHLLEQKLANCEVRNRRPAATYVESVVHLMVPELIRRFKGERRAKDDLNEGVSRFEREVEVG